MAKLNLTPGITSKIIVAKATNLSTGADMTGILYSDIIAHYCTENFTPVGITLATATPGTWTSGGWIQRSAANMPGQYELGLPNAFNAGKSATISIIANGGTSAGMKTIDIEVQFDTSAIVQYPIQKNTAFTTFQFPMTLASDHISPYTGAGSTVSGTVSLDGTEGALTNSGSISAVSGMTGVYMISLTAGDLNGNSVVLKFSATGCDDTKIFFVTQA